MLPEVALLKIFAFYVDEFREPVTVTVRDYHWHILVQVCRNWRNVVFGSPRYLNLRLLSTHRTPVRETIDAWPPLPILVAGFDNEEWGVDNIVAALEYNDRIRKLDFYSSSSSSSPDVDKVLAALHRPFPTLTDLRLSFRVETMPVDPSSFLGGSAPPQLQQLHLSSIPFPGVPKLLLSATHLVILELQSIPHSGYISPETMVTGLAVLTSLERFCISFKSPRSRPDRRSRRPPPPTRTILPALNHLWFYGVSEYLDDLVARIDAPLLNKFEIIFLHQLIFDSPQLIQFLSRIPRFKAYDRAQLQFNSSGVQVTPIRVSWNLRLDILCRPSDWQLSSLAQVLNSGIIPAVKRLSIYEQKWNTPSWQDDIEISQWLEVLHPLTAVKDLYISQGLTPHIAPTLQELAGGRVTEVLPALQTLHFEETPPSGPVQESIGKWVAARQLAGCPVTVSHGNGN